jgi:hypothetical protein
MLKGRRNIFPFSLQMRLCVFLVDIMTKKQTKKLSIDKRLEKEFNLEVQDYKKKLRLESKELFNNIFGNIVQINQALIGNVDPGLFQYMLGLTNEMLKNVLAIQEKVNKVSGIGVIEKTFKNINVDMLEHHLKKGEEERKLLKQVEKQRTETPSYIR